MKILDRVKDEKFIRILRQDKRKSEELRQVIDAFYKSCQSPVVKVTKKLGNK